MRRHEGQTLAPGTQGNAEFMAPRPVRAPLEVGGVREARLAG